MKSKVLSVILFAICSIFLFGCVNIEYQRFMLPDGAIEDVLIFELDDTVPDDQVATILSTIHEDVMKYYRTPINKAIIETGKLEILNGIQVNVLPHKDELRSIKVVTHCDSVEMYATLVNDIFPKVYKQNKEQPEDTSVMNDNVHYEIGTFIIRYIEKTYTAFGNIQDFQLQLIDDTTPMNFYDKYVNDFGGDINDVKLSQMFVSSDTRLQSNANHTMVEGGMKYHLWELDATKPNYQLEFYYRTPNSVGWYYLAIGLTLLTLMVLAIILINVTNKRKPEYKEQVDIKDFDEHNKDF